MDPLSIVTGAVALSGTCVNISTMLYTFINDTRNVDSSIASLYDEVNGLSQVLEAINKSWDHNCALALRQADLDGTLWATVKNSLDDCRTTLVRLERELDNAHRTGFFKKSFLRKPVMQIRLNMSMSDVNVYKQRVQSHNGAMQSALQMISVCLALQNRSAQDSVNTTLAKLGQDIAHIRATLRNRQATQGVSANLLADEDRITRNLRDLVRVAESFHSSASTVMAEGSIRGGSVMGEPLDPERFRNIRDWIPQPVVEEIALAAPTGRTQEIPPWTGLSYPTRPGSVDINSEAESDLELDFEQELLKNIEQLALMNLAQRDYQRAWDFFNEIRPKAKNTQNGLKTDLRLAYCCCFQGKWDEAQDIILPIATERGQAEVMVFHALHAIALYHYQTGNLEEAEKHCKRASLGKRRILGREDDSYYESLDIIARIHHDKGDVAKAEGYKRFLPPHKAEPVLQPLNYMERSMLSYVDRWTEGSGKLQEAGEMTISGHQAVIIKSDASRGTTANTEPYSPTARVQPRPSPNLPPSALPERGRYPAPISGYHSLTNIEDGGPSSLEIRIEEIEKLDLDNYITRLIDTLYTENVTEIFCLNGAEIRAICKHAREVFLSQPMLLELEAPMKIVGDINGQYLDLIDLFMQRKFPTDVRYLFLGNYTSHGMQSLETILLLLCFKLKYPQEFYLLRGKRECAVETRPHGFYHECRRRSVNTRAWEEFIEVFNTLPIAAILDEKIFCVHGGLSPSLGHMDDIRRIARPTDVPDSGLLHDLLWSDPTHMKYDWAPDERGKGFRFGEKAINQFLKRYDFDLVCRADTIFDDGYEFFCKRGLVSIFSAPDYLTKGVVMHVPDDLTCSFQVLRHLGSEASKNYFGENKSRVIALLGDPNS